MPMTDNGDVCFIPAGELVRLYRARKASPLEVMQTVLARIDALNPAVNAYVTIARESALTALFLERVTEWASDARAAS